MRLAVGCSHDRGRGRGETGHVDSFCLLRLYCLASLDQVGKALCELTKLTFVVGLLSVNSELIAVNYLTANHLIEKPVAKNDLSHVP